MTIPVFENAVETQWEHNDLLQTTELRVRFVATRMVKLTDCDAGSEICESVRAHVVERLRREVIESALRKCRMMPVGIKDVYECSECHAWVMGDPSSAPLRYCSRCGAKVIGVTT